MKLKSLLALFVIGIIFLLQSKPPSPNTVSIVPEQADSNNLFGKMLFNDPRLSNSGKTSCASCHKEKYCFADSVPFNTGDDGQLLTLNTLPLIHATQLNRKFFWKGTSDSLNHAIAYHLADPHIMGISDSLLKDRLQRDTTYKKMMARLLPKRTTVSEGISDILSYFIKTIPQNKPTYDQRLGNMKANFNSKVYAALQLCQQCHKNTQEVNGMGNNGLDANDTTLYMVPPLSNLSFTAPYMHDGRFKTLEEVIEHYNNGIVLSPKTDSLLIDKHGNPIQLKLKPADIKQMAVLLRSIQRRNKIQ